MTNPEQYRGSISKISLRAAIATLALLVILVLGLVATQSVQAQTFTVLLSFHGSDGRVPYAGLVQATDGNFYGTTAYGGDSDNGTVFKITPEGTLTTLYSFCSQNNCTDGANPGAGLVQATNGNFYGTTNGGGTNSGYRAGTVFEITPEGTLTTLYSFCSKSNCADGGFPVAGLVQAKDGNFYGTTPRGGAGADRRGGGTVFEITPKGTLTTLYSFCSKTNCADGRYPYAGLVQAKDRNFYGTTARGGANRAGTVFKITPEGTLTTLYSFCSKSNCADGGFPVAGLVQAKDGNFYGTTQYGGANGGYYGYGTVFKTTPKGTLTTLHSFNITDGANPRDGLVQDTDGNFYGTTLEGGAQGYYGTAFKITPKGTLTRLHSFCLQINCTDGAFPNAVRDTNGKIYGTTSEGGTYDGGTVWKLTP